MIFRRSFSLKAPAYLFVSNAASRKPTFNSSFKLGRMPRFAWLDAGALFMVAQQ
jgi:hypothetical protein